jgi:hypothetical protein
MPTWGVFAMGFALLGVALVGLLVEARAHLRERGLTWRDVMRGTWR